MPGPKRGGGALAGAALAAILASGCCAGPVLLAAVGLSSAGLGILTVLEPYRPILIGVSLIALVFAWRAIFRRPKVSAPAGGRAESPAHTIQKVLFWVEAILILILIAFPYFLPPFD